MKRYRCGTGYSRLKQTAAKFYGADRQILAVKPGKADFGSSRCNAKLWLPSNIQHFENGLRCCEPK
jgi:hypothetical protein